MTGAVLAFIALVLGSLAGIASLVTAWVNRNKPRVEQQSMTMGTAEKALEIMERTMDRQDQTIKDLQEAVRELQYAAKVQADALAAESREREKLQRQVDWFKDVTEGDRSWIKRTIDRIHANYPEAWPALLPLPDHATDPGMPAIPRTAIPNPPDDGQPENIATPEGTP